MRAGAGVGGGGAALAAYPNPFDDWVLPRRGSLLAALSEEKWVQTLHSIIPMEDVLFSGIADEAVLRNDRATPDVQSEEDEERFELIEIF